MAAASLNSVSTPRPVAAILTIGNELLSGRTLNTNAAFLGHELTQLGFQVLFQRACPDVISAIQQELKNLQYADVLVVTGGLGPTPDDLTREAIAAHFQVPLRFSKNQFQAMTRVYRKLGKKLPKLSRREAFYPANAKPLVNRFGIALGFRITSANQNMIVLPGVPTELQKMFLHDVRPLLKRKFKKLSAEQMLSVSLVGISEPNIMEKLSNDFFDQPFQFGIYPSEGETQICVRSPSKKIISLLRKKIEKRLENWIFAWDQTPLAEVIGNQLVKKKKTLAVAESCTGGSLAYAWVRYAGASRYFRGSSVVYNAEAKKQIGVSAVTLQKFGEVSGETAAELAIQARKVWNADYGLGVTGVAGPSGGTIKKPIGLVFIAVATKQSVNVQKHLFWGNRDQVQRKAVCKALEQLWRIL